MMRLRSVVGVVIALLVAATSPSATARTNPGPIDDAVDRGPLQLRPWGQAPPNASFGGGPWSSNRDCGLSTPLSNGRHLWVFCDTALFDQNLVLRANPASNTAAIDSATDPLVVSDYLAYGNVTPFIPAPAADTCAGYRATWPSSVATLPDTDGSTTTDRVIVYFQNNCVHWSGNAITSIDYDGIGVAEYAYDASHVGPLVATVLNPDLFPGTDGQDFQFGATVAPDGNGGSHLYLYSCGPGGACATRRVAVSADAAADRVRLATPSAYQAWTGTSWSATATAAALFTGGGVATAPGDGISVAYVPALGRYVMAYTPYPVLHHLAAIRTAPRPEGPWSDPQTVTLPGCSTDHCYAASVQAHLSDATHLGLSYLRWNDFVGWLPAPTNEGRLHVLSIPFGAPGTASITVNDVEHVFEIDNGRLAFEYLWNGSWARWFPIGTGTWIGTPAVVVGTGGAIEVFATAATGEVFHATQGTDGSFPELVPLAGNVVGSGRLAATTMSDGRIELFETDATGHVFHVWQTAVGAAGPTWSPNGFQPVVSGSPGLALDGLAAATTSDGRVEVFTADGQGQIFHTWQRTAGSSTDWAATGFTPVIAGSTFRATRGLAATVEGDGRVHVFAVDPWGQILHTWQNRPGFVTDWSSLGFWPIAGASTAGGISAARGAHGAVSVVAIDRDLMTEQRAVEATPGAPLSIGPFSVF